MVAKTIMVTVVVVTYNQEQYIRRTLDSIVSQVSEYPFQVVIGEDSSSDGTRAICKEYADRFDNIILLPPEPNMGVTANWIRCIQVGTGKYIMSCAGDDYWHNPHKIQLQVDFMEQHPECCLCHTDIDVYYENKGTLEKDYKQSNGIIPPEGSIQKQILEGKEHVSAVTMCIRRSSFERYVPYDEFSRRHFPREDWPTLLVLAAYGDIRYIPVSTATYRVGQESITRDSDYDRIIQRAKKDKEMTEYLYSIFPEWGVFNDAAYFDQMGYSNALRAAYRNNDYYSANKFAKKSKSSSWAAYMAYSKLSFTLFRWIQLMRNRI